MFFGTNPRVFPRRLGGNTSLRTTLRLNSLVGSLASFLCAGLLVRGAETVKSDLPAIESFPKTIERGAKFELTVQYLNCDKFVDPSAIQIAFPVNSRVHIIEPKGQSSKCMSTVNVQVDSNAPLGVVPVQILAPRRTIARML